MTPKSESWVSNNQPLATAGRLKARRSVEPPARNKLLNSSRQFPDRCFQRFGNRLNCKKTRIFQATLNAAQKSTINVGSGSKTLLRQLSLQSGSPNTLSESFGNIMTHLRQSCLQVPGDACRLYTTTLLDSYSSRCPNRLRLVLRIGVLWQICGHLLNGTPQIVGFYE